MKINEHLSGEAGGGWRPEAGRGEQGHRGEFRAGTLLRPSLSQRWVPVAGRTSSTPTQRTAPSAAVTQRLVTCWPCSCRAPMPGVRKQGARVRGCRRKNGFAGTLRSAQFFCKRKTAKK